MSQVVLEVPDIGEFKDVAVVEVIARVGDSINVGDTLVTVESDKATLDLPAAQAGRIAEIRVVPGSRVSKGSPLVTIEVAEAAIAADVSVASLTTRPPEAAVAVEKTGTTRLVGSNYPTAPEDLLHERGERQRNASPSVRRAARELNVDLAEVIGSGPRGRILKADVHEFVRSVVAIRPRQTHDHAAPVDGPPMDEDFALYGIVERRSLSRIQKLTGAALARNWAKIPHVTNFNEADVTALEEFRRSSSDSGAESTKLTLLSFIIKACAVALKSVPGLNVSLDGEDMVLKKYVHIGIAVDSPKGLVVPVIRDVDQLGVLQIAARVAEYSRNARAGTLKLADLRGGTFTISSLGGLSTTGFTPIINGREVGILGVARANIQARWDGSQFRPRLILPLALSWDHRALDGVTAARFLVRLKELLEDFRLAAL